MYDNLAVMVMELSDDVNVDKEMSRFATMQRQAEEEYVPGVQQCLLKIRRIRNGK